MQKSRPKKTPRRGILRAILVGALLALAAFYAGVVSTLVALRSVDPPFTAVQIQRRIESWFGKGRYAKRYSFVPVKAISRDLQHAVVASEDARFFLHRGFDWEEIKAAIHEDLEEGRGRGASTITQQLVKNLYLTTRGSLVRKGLEFTLVPLAERILGKPRILELYLNVVEWGPGVYGAEAAAQYHYHASAASLSRDQSARLAAILPSPRHRKPGRMDELSAEIQRRMAQAGW